MMQRSIMVVVCLEPPSNRSENEIWIMNCFYPAQMSIQIFPKFGGGSRTQGGVLYLSNSFIKNIIDDLIS